MTVASPDILSSPHKHDGSTVRSVMSKVLLALVPGILCHSWFFGPGIFLQCLLAIVFSLVLELILLRIRGRETFLFLKDGSVIVTALLFALMITPLTPWWISLIGLAFGLVFAKHLYGGLGHNLFNPAATAYLFILLCFPALLNPWPAPGGGFAGSVPLAVIMDNIFSMPGSSLAGLSSIDTLSGATALADMQAGLAAMNMVSEIDHGSLYGQLGGYGWEWINVAFLAGGLWLVMAGIVNWRIPLAMLVAFFSLGLLCMFYDSDRYASPLFHLFSGGTMLGAFFVASDPVTAASTPRGRLIYGGLIGLIAYSIRTWGAYPDGIAFAVLLANCAVPLIDRHTRPKVIGEA